MRIFLLSVFLGVVLHSNAWSSTESRYSDLNDKVCKITSQADEGEGDWVNCECPGVGDFRLLKLTDDDRESLSLLHKGKEQSLNFFDNITPTFNHLGEKVEWRFFKGQPVALIVRMYFKDSETRKAQQRLIIAKVLPKDSCVTDVIDAIKIPNANGVAREAADRASTQKCLWAPPHE